MSKFDPTFSPAWCDNKIITYDFCLNGYGCYSGTTSPAGILNGKVYYEIPSSPIGYLWWSRNLKKWIFSNGLGDTLLLTLDYNGEYPYSPSVKWDGEFSSFEFFRTCDCTCFTKPVYTENNFLPVNECGIITIYPMDVTCIPIPPIKPDGNGSLTLEVVGGTPPYSIRLLNSTGNSTYGVIGSSNVYTIPNLLVGTYFVEVTDNFGDFQQVINCSIEFTTPTPSPTPIPLPPTPTYQEYTFCMEVTESISIDVRNPFTTTFQISFNLQTFTSSSINNIVTPIFASNTGNELIYWNYTTNRWSLSASTSSSINSNYIIINTKPISELPIGPWILINLIAGVSLTALTTSTPCKNPNLIFWINESWWQYYVANIPNEYRGSSCGGDNETPWFKWVAQELGSATVSYYDILCTNNGTGDIYFDVTNIDSNQIEISNTIPWITTPTPPTINPTTGGGTANSEGWEGPCLPALSNPNFTVTLTAYLSSGPPLTASINFIYCQTVTNGICVI
jgi:hypothetical protein